MKGKATMCFVAVLSLSCGGFAFAQDNSTASSNGQYWKGQHEENQQFRSDLKNSNDTGTQKHTAVVQHRVQQHQENVAHRVDHKAEWDKKMAERRVARERHMAELRAEREKRIAERKARFHQHHAVSSNATSSEHPQ